VWSSIKWCADGLGTSSLASRVTYAWRTWTAPVSAGLDKVQLEGLPPVPRTICTKLREAACFFCFFSVVIFELLFCVRIFIVLSSLTAVSTLSGTGTSRFYMIMIVQILLSSEELRITNSQR